MKTKLQLLTVLLLACLSYGCIAPGSYLDDRKNYETDYKSKNDSIEFKYAFRYIMPRSERINFERKLENSNYKSDTWTKSMQREGFNALAIGSSGVGAFSSSGQSVGLGLSLVDSYLTGLSELKYFAKMYFSDEWLGETYQTKDEAHQIAMKKTVQAIEVSMNELGYNIECILNCGELISTFEFTRTRAKGKEEYAPDKLYAHFYAIDVTETNELDRKVFTKDSHYKAENWKILIYDFDGKGIEDARKVELEIAEKDITSFSDKSTYHIAYGDSVFQTRLGRKIARSLSAKLTNWVVADTDRLIEYGLLNGEVYRFRNTSKARKFYGMHTTN